VEILDLFTCPLLRENFFANFGFEKAVVTPERIPMFLSTVVAKARNDD
jgi:hypothetical protein